MEGDGEEVRLVLIEFGLRLQELGVGECPDAMLDRLLLIYHEEWHRRNPGQVWALVDAG